MILCAGALAEHDLLALAAYRVGKKLQWDADIPKAKGCAEGDKYITKTYRKGWTLNG